MRLSPEIIGKCSSYFNTLKQREIDLRGFKISQIENLGTTRDQYDSIDLSDNQITIFENFPQLSRLSQILMCNNQLNKIDKETLKNLPHLESLILSNNRFTNLEDIDSLAEVSTLRRLSLLDNPVSKKKNYRLYVIHKIPSLKLLDFKKITEQERKDAKAIFQEETQVQHTKKAKVESSQVKKKTK